jgi:hypothetical protein
LKRVLVLCFGGAILLAGCVTRPAWAQSVNLNGRQHMLPVSRTSLQPKDKWNQSKLPLAFEENRGQAGSGVRFLSHTSDGTLAFTPNQVMLPCSAGAKAISLTIETDSPMQVKGEDPTGGVVNYYSGSDRSRWIESVPLERQVRYTDAAEGVDLVFHGNSGQLEYDLEVAPSADVKAISFRAGPGAKFQIQADGAVTIQAEEGSGCDRVRFLAPRAYQTIDGVGTAVDAMFTVDEEGSLRFSVGEYDHRLPLTIDPVVAYTTILGVNNATTVAGVQVDGTGDVFVTGETNATNYPVAGAGLGGISPSGEQQVYVTKLDPTGTQILYSTYIPSPGFNGAAAIALDASGNAYVAGTAASSSFPTTSQNLGMCSPSFCNTGFVAKFNTTGAMVYSTMIGTGQQVPLGIVVDAGGNALIAGITADPGLQTVNAYQSNYLSGICTTCSGAFFAKLNPSGTAWVFASYFTGVSASDLETYASAIALDTAGDIYIAGPGDGVPLRNSFQQGIGGSFAAEFAPDGKTLLFSTILGGTVFGTTDQPLGMQVGPDGTIFLAGVADAQDFPYTPVAMMHELYSGATQNMYAAGINPGRTGFTFSTDLGQGNVYATAMDAHGNFYVAGRFSQGSLPFKNAVAADIESGGFILELNSAGALVNSTAFGGRTTAQPPTAMAVDGAGNIYIAGIPVESTSGGVNFLDPINIGSGTTYSTQADLGYSASFVNYSTFIAKIAPAVAPQISLSYSWPVLELLNAGSADLHISSIQLSGGYANANSTCGSTVTAGTSCFLAPTDANGDLANGTITIYSDAQPSSQSFTPPPAVLPKVPTPLGAYAIVDGSQFIFPPVENGTTSNPEPILIWNVGTASLSGISVQPSTGIQQTNNCSSVAPQKFCTVQVSLSPPANYGDPFDNSVGIVFGTSSATSLYTNFTQNRLPGPLLLSVNGYGLGYGNVPLGQTSIARIVTVTNSGNSAVSVADPSITGTGSSAFSVSSNSCSDISLQPQQSCVIAVVFQPTTTGRLSVPMTITGGGYSNTIYLVGYGVAVPSVSISPSTVNLGNVVVGNTATQVFEVTNNSSASLTITNITATLASGAFSTEYSESDTCQSAALAVGASCLATVTLTPQAAGSRNGVLTLSLNGGIVSESALLTATATGPSTLPTTLTLTANPSTSEYGQQIVLTALLAPYSEQGASTNGEAVTFLNGANTLGTATLSSGVATLNVTSLATGIDGLSASYAGDANFSSAKSNALFYTVAQATPVITWATPAAIPYGTALSGAQLNATASTAGTFLYVPTAGTVLSGGNQTLWVGFTPTDTNDYTTASDTVQLTVNNAPQTITFTPPSSPVTYGVSPITLSATGGGSGNPVVISVVSGPGTISGSVLTITGVGTIVIAANQAGNTYYTAATQVTQTIVVNQATPTITITVPNHTYGDAPFTVSATSNSTGTVTYSVVSGPATISGSTVTLTGAGTVVLQAGQAAAGNYAAGTQTATFTVATEPQIISFTAPTSPVTYGVSPITLVATGGASGNEVVFSVVSGPGMVSGSTLAITGVGTVVVAANQAGNANYAAATQVTQSIVVNVIGVAATPTFSPVAGTYTAAQTVSISDSTSGATIYYTTNGSTPSTSSTVYSGAITVSSTETLEAIATATGYSTSAVATGAYTISIPTNPVPAISGISPAFTNAGGIVFTLTVNGSGFIANSTTYWGASALSTTYVSATQLTAQVPSADIATAGTIAITVQTPAPGGGTSNAWQFEVDSVSSGSTAPTITSTTETVAAGSTASYPVTMPSSVTSVSVTCLNLPTGASCSYSSTTNTVTIATSSTTPKGTYQITVVFTETVTSAAFLLPILLLPLAFIRRKHAARGIWLTACLGLVILATAALSTGCGSSGGGGSGSTTPPATHQVTSSGAVSLTIQ